MQVESEKSTEKNTQQQINLIDFVNKTFLNNVKTLTKKLNIPDSAFASKSNSKFSVWFLNELLVPVQSCPDNATDDEGLISLRFYDCETSLSMFGKKKFSPVDGNFDFDPENEFLSFDSINQIESSDILKKNQKSDYIYTLNAFDKCGQLSCPLVIFPSSDPLKTCFKNPAIKNTICLSQSKNGDLTSVNFFIDWLDLFIKQSDPSVAKLIFGSKYLMVRLRTLLDQESFSVVKNKLIENRIYLLFYPFENKINEVLKDNFNEIFTKNLIEYSQRENPNNDLAFLFVFKQSYRQFVQQYKSQVFELLIEENKLEFSVSDLEDKSENSGTSTQESDSQDVENYKLSDSEVESFCFWIDEMSKIGSLCIKHTFLRDLNLRNRADVQSLKKEFLCPEKRWNEFIAKNRAKFKNPNSIGLMTESEYLLRTMNLAEWKQKYTNLVVNELKIEKGDQLWNFEIITFPFIISTNTLRQPEKDVDRPKNNKPKISVLFAYNAAGDYLQPFFVFPQNLLEDNAENSSHECFSINGYVTPKIFSNWVLNVFMPYIGQSKDKILLLYCAKLSIVDRNLLSALNEPILKDKLNLFGICADSFKPFNMLFTKISRNRPSDLFLDSWRKVTSKLKLSHQFKCKSRQQFFNLFMDTFQNCIEEIGNEDGNQSLNLSSVSAFREKMINTFEHCKLWPVDLCKIEPKPVIVDKEEPSPKRKRVQSTERIKNTISGNKENSLKISQLIQLDSKSRTAKKKVQQSVSSSINGSEIICDLINLLIESKCGQNECNDEQDLLENFEQKLDLISAESPTKLDAMRKIFDQFKFNTKDNSNKELIVKLGDYLNKLYNSK